MSSPDCPPVWQKLLVCSQEASALALAAGSMGEYWTEADQRKCVKIIEKFEEEMEEFLSKFTAGWEKSYSADPHHP